MIAGLWVTLVLLGAAGPGGAAEPPPPVAVFPVAIKVPLASPQDASTLLTSLLTDAVAQTGRFRVLGADEVSALIAQEAERQGMGCSDDGCLAELAGALGVRLVVGSDVTGQEGALLWSVSLVDQMDSTVVRRASVPGANLEELVPQVAEVALVVAGDEEGAALQGEAARRRFGLRSKEDLAQFAAYRKAHPKASTPDAFTSFILEHNVESRALSVATAVALATGVLGTAAATVLAGASVTGLLLFGLAVPLLLPLQLVLGLVGLGAVTVGLVLAVVDSQNTGRVVVDRKGCCRNDRELRAAARQTGWHRGSSAIALLAGAALLLAGWTLPLVGAALVYGSSVAFLVRGGWLPMALQNEIGLSPVSIALHACALCGVCVVCPVTLGAGSVTALVGGLGLVRADAPLVEAGPAQEQEGDGP